MVNARAVNVKDITSHLVTVIESPFGNWFLFDDVRSKGDGYDRARVTLDDEEGSFRLDPEKGIGPEQVMASLRKMVCPKTDYPPTKVAGWDDEGRPYWILTPSLFSQGVARAWNDCGDREFLRHLGKGEWDIDCIGADFAVQYALFGGTIYG